MQYLLVRNERRLGGGDALCAPPSGSGGSTAVGACFARDRNKPTVNLEKAYPGDSQNDTAPRVKAAARSAPLFSEPIFPASNTLSANGRSRNAVECMVTINRGSCSDTSEHPT